mgnify:CR=1 FL=1
MSKGIARHTEHGQKHAGSHARVHFKVHAEHQRGDETHKDAAQGAPHGDGKVIARQSRGFGSQPVELAVADVAAAKQSPAISQKLVLDAQARPRVVRDHHRNDGAEHGQNGPVTGIPAGARERDNERHQVKAQGQHPQKRNAGDVLTELIGYRQQHHAGAHGQRHPQAPRHERGRRSLRRTCIRSETVVSAAKTHRRTQQGEQHEASRPGISLVNSSKPGLKQERIAQQGQQRPDI